jgi:hypothetical protein
MKKFPYNFNRAIDLADILHVSGSDNTAGVQQKVMFAKLEDIDILPQPDVDDSAGSGALDGLVTISQNIRMKPYKKFNELYVTLETGKIDSNSQGELDGMSFKNVLDFFHPGSSAQILGFAQWAKNSDLIFLVPESDGQVRILGHKGYPAKMTKAQVTTGAKGADRKGNGFTFESTRKGPAPIFKGHVDLMGSGFGSGDANDLQTISFIA